MKRWNRILLFTVMGVWLVVMAANLLAPYRTFSEDENRYLAELPRYTVSGLIDGSSNRAMDNYINDHFFARHVWIMAQSTMELASGKRENNGVYYGKGMLFSKLAQPDAALSEANLQGIEAFASRTGANCTVMLVPSAAAVVPQLLPAAAPVWDEAAWIGDAYAQLSPQVRTVDVLGALCAHPEQQLYYRTDHHWTTQGAYLGYAAYAQAAGLEVRTPQQMRATTLSTDFRGTLDSKSGAWWIKSDTILAYQSGEAASYEVFTGMETRQYDDIWFEEYLAKKDKYSVFFGEISPRVTVKTESKSGKKLLVFKDSYAHCLVPMLMEDYSEITMIDLRYWQQPIEQLVDVTQYEDVLFLYNLDSFTTQEQTAKLR